MLKNKTKIISILTAIILLISTTFVLAENEDATVTSEDPQAVTTETQNQTQENTEEPTAQENTAGAEDATDATTTVTEDNYKKSDVYLTGEDVTVDYIVDGNLFIIANNVTINSQIGGDAFIIANSVTVAEQGYVYSNLFTLANEVNIKGVIYDAYTAAKNVTVSGYVYRDIKSSCETLNIFGTIGRNAFVSASNINFKSETTADDESQQSVNYQGNIAGNLEYASANELQFPEGTIGGETRYSAISAQMDTTSKIETYISSIGGLIATCLIVWLLCLWLAPKFVENADTLLTKKAVPVVGFGILTPIVAVIAAIILIIIGITSGVGLLSLGLLFMMMGISTSIFIIAINSLICKKANIDKNTAKAGMLIVSSIVLGLLGLIPVVGSIVKAIASIIGLGIIVVYIIPEGKGKKTKTEKVDSSKNNEKETNEE